jgi:hypothetical protein
MPILGVVDSAKSGNLSNPAYYFIAKQVASSTRLLTFTSIPQTYKHLELRLSNRYSAAGTSQNGVIIYFNNDQTAGNYWVNHNITGYQNAFSASTLNSTDGVNGMLIAANPRSGTLANTFYQTVTKIPDYTNANINKTVRSVGGGAIGSAESEVGIKTGLWFPSTSAAITQIDISTYSTGNYVDGTVARLYGIKG